MLVARFRLAAPLSSLGVIVASMGQPNADVPRDVARGGRFSIQPGGRGTSARPVPTTAPRITLNHVSERRRRPPLWVRGDNKGSRKAISGVPSGGPRALQGNGRADPSS